MRQAIRGQVAQIGFWIH